MMQVNEVIGVFVCRTCQRPRRLEVYSKLYTPGPCHFCGTLTADKTNGTTHRWLVVVK